MYRPPEVGQKEPSKVRRRVSYVIVAALLLWVIQIANAHPAGATTNKTRVPMVVTHHHNALTTWRYTEQVAGLCDEYRNGIFAGWIIGHDQYAFTEIGYVHVYTFGDWHGAYCSNHVRIWSVNWGGEPGGWANQPIWHWDRTATRVYTKDNQGDFRYKGWDTHFWSGLAVHLRDDYPWLYVSIGVDQSIGGAHGCGC
jgi:hypothetical protein